MAGNHFRREDDEAERRLSEARAQAPLTGAQHMRSASDGLTGKRQLKDSRARYKSSGAYNENDPYGLKRKRKHSKAGVIATAFLIIGICLLVVAGVMWGGGQLRYLEQNRINEQLAEHVELPEGGGAPVVDWDALLAVNGDVVGWICVPGTVINYPVYQGDDNTEYLNTSALGQYSIGGQIFLDYQNVAPGMLDAQTIIYGHHLKNGTMFKAIADMANQGFFDGIHTVWYVTPNATYELAPLFLYYTNGSDTTVRVMNFDDAESFHNYLSQKLSVAQTARPGASEIIGGIDHAMLLITCNYEVEDGRTVLVCVPKDEAGIASGEDA